MHILRLLAVLLMLLTAGNTGYAYTFNENHFPLDKEITSQLSEELVDLSSSHLVTSAEVFKNRLHTSSAAKLEGENPREFSKANAYYSFSRLLEPGLSLPDIIFPFHTFL